jgi:hypothetical protein
MLIKFTESTDFEDRHYARGDVREFDAKTAKQLIESGVAVDPAKAKEEKVAPVAEKSAVKTTSGKK